MQIKHIGYNIANWLSESSEANNWFSIFKNVNINVINQSTISWLLFWLWYECLLSVVTD